MSESLSKAWSEGREWSDAKAAAAGDASGGERGEGEVQGACSCTVAAGTSSSSSRPPTPPLLSVKLVSSQGHMQLGGAPHRKDDMPASGGGAYSRGAAAGHASGSRSPGGESVLPMDDAAGGQAAGSWRPAAAQGLRLAASMMPGKSPRAPLPSPPAAAAPGTSPYMRPEDVIGWMNLDGLVSPGSNGFAPQLQYEDGGPTLLESPRRSMRMTSRSSAG